MMNKVKIAGAGCLLLLGFWGLGRALETSLNRDPRLIDRRETITAGLLLGGPAIAGGGWLLWDQRRQRQRQAAQHLRRTFFQLLKAGRGRITPLDLAMAANLDGDVAQAYLRDRSLEYNATFDIDDDGNMTYCFHLGDATLDRSWPLSRRDRDSPLA